MQNSMLNTPGSGLLWQRCAPKRLSNALKRRSSWLRWQISAQCGRSKYLSMPSGERNRLNVALIAPSALRIGHGIRVSKMRYGGESLSMNRPLGWMMRMAWMPTTGSSGRAQWARNATSAAIAPKKVDLAAY